MKQIARGVRKRCPNCGGSDLFTRWWTMRRNCPTCGMKFERDAGYGTGAMIVNTAATIGTFLVVFVGIMVATWPDVPWTAALVITIIVNTFVPIVFYPWSKTIFLGLDLAVRPLSTEEADAASVWLRQSGSTADAASATD